MDPRTTITRISTFSYDDLLFTIAEAEKEELRSASNAAALGLYVGPGILVAAVMSMFSSSGPTGVHLVVVLAAIAYAGIGVQAHYYRKPWRDLIEACKRQMYRLNP